ncbi:hypothetical protein GWK47_011779 [Chionoecetes opilio]|uniref:Uncharacterized protein n=1 Tax=Chionoecetes opilio TaxID=41210 RepID=A0A8J4XVA5_CHIOP|nr:hypothetical protein GWK47_011779 [Chionoecetes opilio]
MAVQDSLNFSLLDTDCIEMLYNNLPGIDFEEIANEAAVDMHGVMQDGNLGLPFDNTKITQDGNIGLHFDNTKIMRSNWVDLPFDNTKLTQDMSGVTMGLPLPPMRVVVQAPAPSQASRAVPSALLA